MLTRPQAIIFDVYDTLFANSIERWQEAFESICAEQGLSITGADLWSRWKRYEVGFRASRTNMKDPASSEPFRSYEKAWAGCFERVFAEEGLGGDAAQAAARSVEHMSQRTPFPETIEALATLRPQVRLGVLSNADDAFLLPTLKRHGLQFDAVASSESARVYKPHPGAFHHILKLMKLAPDQAWYVGDHPFDDVLGANGVGMQTVWINRAGAGFDSSPAPDEVITDLSQLSDLLERAR